MSSNNETPTNSNSLAPGAAYRTLPAVDALLRDPAVATLARTYGSAALLDVARSVLADARSAIAAGAPEPDANWAGRVAARLAARTKPSLQPVINATGIIIHTNLGRAPLSEQALAAIAAVGHGYSTLEYNLEAGERGSRHDHARRLIQRITGAEDALVVNNNAAAVYLVLAAFCQGREVIISRSQLVEIGGGYRIPDVLVQGGARLVEVGTTNRTHARDFAGAITPDTAAILRVHSSNFRQIGFVAMPSLEEMAAIAHAQTTQDGRAAQNAHAPLLLIDDLGSGSLLDTRPYGLAAEPMVQESLAAGADLVTFSGDKLLGGPQAGIIVGRAALIEALRRHPLARALRVDKSTLAALEATLRAYDRGAAVQELPVWRMIAATVEQIQARATGWQQALAADGTAATNIAGESAVGGGSLPGETLPTWLLAVAVAQPTAAAAALRHAATPIICRIQNDALLFDPRTVLPEQDEMLLDGVRTILANRPG
jgi:L-seryl-tRNA(Ser) seleniumtransferase